jgi:hypothetical protein
MSNIRIKMKRIFLIVLAAVLFGLPCGVRAFDGWHAKIYVKSGDVYSHLIIAGHKTTTDGYDTSEIPAWLGGDLQVYFYYPDWPRGDYYWSDYRDLSLPQEWPFYVQTNNITVVMSWKLVDVPATLELNLVDEYTGTTIDIKSNPTYTYESVSTGARFFRITASGSIGGEEPPPGETDTVPPETAITSDMPEFTGSQEVSLTYSGTDNVTPPASIKFSYSVDGGGWSAWTTDTSASITGLSDGPHTIRVKSRDEAGNEDPTPAEETCTVDTTLPALQLGAPSPSTLLPPDGTMRTVLFSGSAADAGSGLGTLTYTMIDEYGEFGSSGSITLLSSGGFSFNLSLKAWRDGTDPDGRTYTVIVTAVDNVGNESKRTVRVTVPHDERLTGWETGQKGRLK